VLVGVNLCQEVLLEKSDVVVRIVHVVTIVEGTGRLARLRALFSTHQI
jgi:hypothetical protein